MLITSNFNHNNLRLRSSIQKYVQNKLSIATLSLLGCQIQGTNLTIPLGFSISKRFTSKLPEEPVRPIRGRISDVGKGKGKGNAPVEPLINSTQVANKPTVPAYTDLLYYNDLLHYLLDHPNINKLDDILEDYRPKLNNPGYLLFMSSYDKLLKNKSPYHKNERLFFSQIYRNLNNRLFLDLFRLNNLSYFKEQDSYFCSYVITNIPYKQMVLIKTIFLFPLEKLKYLNVTQDKMTYYDCVLGIDIFFDLLRFVVCSYAQEDELPNCFAKDIMMKGNGLAKKIYHNFQEGLKIYDPLNSKYCKKP